MIPSVNPSLSSPPLTPYNMITADHIYHHQQFDIVSPSLSMYDTTVYQTAEPSETVNGHHNHNQVADTHPITPLSEGITTHEKSAHTHNNNTLPRLNSKWQCFYGNCTALFNRKDDLIWKHMVSTHFKRQIKYKCFMHEKAKNNNKERPAARRDIAMGHINKCWKKHFNKLPGNKGLKVPKEVPNNMYQFLYDECNDFHCGFPDCNYTTSLKKEFEKHLSSVHDKKNGKALGDRCPHCNQVIVRTRYEAITYHISKCQNARS
ncbi:hypothetical protein BDA99DRAFT_285561 [Phascolomyces articulosus]|uniref:C2H2-type domain-containing protein n=1 Tax=Phascolomyces articulosus TaxID=60185 RepID=A0AAD5JYK1_9FUNG|nr:hypothetical protein BDA99DRAFT_285561 [Phascolomyces articulosus]